MLDVAARQVEAMPPDAGEVLNVLGGPMTVKQDGSNGLYLAEHTAPPGYAVPLHVHDEDDETFWILDGILTPFVAGGEHRAGPGSCVVLPRGVPHGFRNDSATPVRLLVMCTPGRRIAAMFRALDHLTTSGALTGESIGAVCGQYGVRML